jgi:hypothetical protein
MDFIVSKVAMAVCALLVITVLAGLFTEGALLGGDNGFEHILDEFCELAERTAMGEAFIAWDVPFLPSGESVTISIHKGTVLVESNEGAAARKPACGLHLWRSDGRCLNESMVTALDDGAGSLIFESGQTAEIVSQILTFENEARTFVFVHMLD